MELENFLISADSSIRKAVEQLERYRCKTIYAVKNFKLIASISDGDVRRFSLKNGNMEEGLQQIGNYSPKAFYENELEEAKKVFEKTDMQSIPILNLNDEIVYVLLRNEIKIREQKKLQIPVVIMAGGKGSRLYPYTKILPKALIPIGEMPITEHIINRFAECGCNHFYLVLNHKKNMVKSYFDNIKKEYSLSYVDEEIPLGTGGGLSLLKGLMKEDIAISNCDILIDADYSKIYEFHKNNQNFITIIATEKCIKIPYGVIRVDEDSLYSGVIEKPEHRYIINTGFYIVNALVVEEMEEDKEASFPDIIDNYYKQGKKIGIYKISEKAFMDMGQLEELESMKKTLGF